METNPTLPVGNKRKGDRKARRSVASRKTSSFHDSVLSRDTLNVGEFREQLKSCIPEGSNSSYLFRWNYLLDEVLSKYTVPGDAEGLAAREKAALDKLLATEETCRDINRNGYRHPDESLNAILFRSQRLIADILGDVPDDLFDGFQFSTGATTSHTRKRGNPVYKWHNRGVIHSTAEVMSLAKTMLYSGVNSHVLPLPNDYIKTVDGDVVKFVPKSEKIERVIAPGPDVNIGLQRCVGKYIRKRLRAYGINLRDQSLNQRLAYEGSISGRLATVDSSNASDNISDRIVWDLLPPRWYRILNGIRAKRTTAKMADGTSMSFAWEKFAPQGNGFIFELETLLFYALTVATSQIVLGDEYNHRDIAVYGDDIICHSDVFLELHKLWGQLGWQMNVDKSFYGDNPFRESCGKHYHNGVDVTPFYIRSPVDSVPRYIWLLNKMRSWSSNGQDVADPSLYSLWTKLKRKYIPNELYGSNDVDSVVALASPESPRKRLKTVTERVVFTNYRGFYSRHFGGINVGTSYYEHFSSSSGLVGSHMRMRSAPAHVLRLLDRNVSKLVTSDEVDPIVVTELEFFKLIGNEERDTLKLPLFPKEIGVLSEAS